MWFEMKVILHSILQFSIRSKERFTSAEAMFGTKYWNELKVCINSSITSKEDIGISLRLTAALCDQRIIRETTINLIIFKQLVS